MQARLQAEFQKREKASARKLTAAEALTAAEIKRAVAATQARLKEALPDDDDEETKEVSRRIPFLLPLLATEIASILRRRSTEVRGEEQRAMHARVVEAYGASAIRMLPQAATTTDAASASLAGQAIATRWGQAALAVNAPYRTMSAPPPSALALVEPTIRREAATITARAFNDGREDVLRTYDSLPGAFKIWSAVLDIKTCPTCRKMDGDYVPFGKTFALDPPVHPNCRCIIETLITGPDLAKRMPGFRIDYEEFKRFVKDSRVQPGRMALEFASKSMEKRSPVVLQREIHKRK